MAFETIPADLHVWQDTDSDSDFARDAVTGDMFAQQWKLRRVAQEAALREIADGELRRPSVHNQSFGCADVKERGRLSFIRQACGSEECPGAA